MINALLERLEGALDDILRLLDGRSHRIICTLGRRPRAEEEGPGVGPPSWLLAAHRVGVVLGRLFWSLGGSLRGRGQRFGQLSRLCDHELASGVRH